MMEEKYKNIDHLFKDTFEDFELDPPEHIWNNVQQGIKNSNGSSFGRNYLKGGIIGVSGVIVVIGLLYLAQLYKSPLQTDNIINATSKVAESDNTYNNSGNQLLAVQYKPEAKIQSTVSRAQMNSSEEVNRTLSDNTDTIKGNIPDEYRPITIGRKQKKDNNDKSLVSLPENKIAKYGLNASNGSSGYLNPDSKNELTSLSQRYYVGSVITSGSSIPEQIEGIESRESGFPQRVKSDYGKKGSFSLGLFFTPEIIYHPSDNNFTNNKYSLDINGIYQISGFLIQSGIGFAWSSDNGNYKVDYNEYLGSYEDVYNVTFDTTGSEIVPVYHTETVNVYDSITHIKYTTTKNRYTYLQIPALFGYGKDYRRFGWFIKGGPSVSILIHKNIPDVNVQSEESRVLGIENKIPSRINIHWQFILSGGLKYRLSNRFSFMAEPMFRVYINSAYIGNEINTKHPYSVGLRTGFLLDF